MSARKRNLVIPELKIIKGSIFGCCATHIKEEYEDLDVYVETPKEEIKFNSVLCDDSEPTYEGNLNFMEIMTKLGKERASEYYSWVYVGIALINLHHRKIFTRGQLYDIYDLFSSKADNYSQKDVFKMLDTNIPRFDGKGYGIKYLLDCLKVDDNEYYKAITKKRFNN